MHTCRHALVAMTSAALATSALTLAAPAHAADKDCSDFASQKAAQLFFLANGGPQSDPHRLDGEGDGLACETLPGPYYYGTTPPDSGGGGSTAGSAVVKQRARVVAVVDGDTLDVRLASGAQKRVRMLGIDTPEVHGTVECGGPQASRSMKRLTPRRTVVQLVSDPTQDRSDRYGRLLRYVSKAGVDMNRKQVGLGWARTYVYADSPFRRVTAYRSSQQAARALGRGIWSLCR